MTEDILDLSAGRKVKGATAEFTHVKYTNSVAAAHRAAEQHAEDVAGRVFAEQRKLSTTDVRALDRLDADAKRIAGERQKAAAKLDMIEKLAINDDRAWAAIEALDALDAEAARLAGERQALMKDPDPAAWEPLEAEVFDAKLATLVPLLRDSRGREPTVDVLRGEFSYVDIDLVAANAIRPTARPDWAITR